MNSEAAVPSGAIRRPEQFTTVHALRGLAASWVVLFHVYKVGTLDGSHIDAVPWLTRILFDYGRGGVAVFFVISGFVISHSLREAKPDLGYVGRFMLRRSIRLDPPYWASIAVVIVLDALLAHRRGLPVSLPDPAVLGAHLFYLQELLRLPELQLVYWTLTYEIQFYLMFVIALAWHQAWQRAGRRVMAALLPGLLIVAAFVAAAEHQEWVLHGLFLNNWHAFAAGCLACSGGHGRRNWAAVLLVPLGITMLISAPSTAEVFNSPAALTAFGLLIAGRARALSRGLGWRPLQFLGTVSYSLYLMHIPTINVVTSLYTTLVPQPSVGTSIGRFVVVTAACVLVAALFWRAIEWPTHRLAKRVGAGQAPSRAAGDGPAIVAHPRA